MLIDKRNSKYTQRAWHMQSLAHWCTSLILINLSTVRCGWLPSYQLDHSAVCWVAACHLMSPLPSHCYACHTCSMCGGNVNSNAGLISVNAAVCFTRLPNPITADHYCYSGHIGIGGDPQTDVIEFTYTATPRVFTHRYQSNTTIVLPNC